MPTIRVVGNKFGSSWELETGLPEIVKDPETEMGEVLIEDIFAPGNKIEFLQAQIEALSEEERATVVSKFCQFCGDYMPCQCMNDD